MLVLQRGRGESIAIIIDGKTIATISVLDVFGHKARLGCEAEPSVVFMREELLPERQPEEVPS